MAWTPGAEQRRYPRKEKQFLVSYRVVDAAGKNPSPDLAGQVLNFSRTGIYLVARQKLSMGDTLEIDIPENVFAGGARTMRGVVRRIDMDTPRGTPAGLMFVKADRAGTPGKEERRHPRKPRNLTVSFRCTFPEDLDHIGQRQGRIVNVSKKGMELWARRGYPVGTEIEVDLPKNPLGTSRTILTRVVWTRADRKNNWNRIGLTVVESPAKGQ